MSSVQPTGDRTHHLRDVRLTDSLTARRSMEMKMEIAKLRQHAYDLTRAFSVILDLRPELPPDVATALGLTNGRKIVIAKSITDETSYAVVLHEMGHHLSPFGSLRGVVVRMEKPTAASHPRDRHRWMNLMLEEEEAAWTWARHYALEWTVAMQMVESSCYATYVETKKRTR